jgi:DNA-binding Xre family transcriptional regulator
MNNPIGTKIKQLASKKNLSINKLEIIAGLQKGRAHEIISGKSKNPTVNTLSKICNALECTFNDLLSDLLENKELSEKPFLLTGLKGYANLKLDYELYIKSVETIKKYLEKHEVNIKLNTHLALIVDLYLNALIKNNKQINEEYGEWLIEKQRICIPIKLND